VVDSRLVGDSGTAPLAAADSAKFLYLLCYTLARVSLDTSPFFFSGDFARIHWFCKRKTYGPTFQTKPSFCSFLQVVSPGGFRGETNF
jgi:hypothetical protein